MKMIRRFRDFICERRQKKDDRKNDLSVNLVKRCLFEMVQCGQNGSSVLKKISMQSSVSETRKKRDGVCIILNLVNFIVFGCK